MSEELQALLDHIKTDGIKKAEAEAKAIIEAAKKEAEGIKEAANAEAAKTKADAARDADAFRSRAEATVRQAMRDVKLQLAEDLERQAAAFVAGGVDAAFADAATVAGWIGKAVDGYLGQGEKGIEIALGGEVAAMAGAIKASLAKKATEGGIAIESSPAFPNGFTIKLDGGRVEQCFTAEAVTDALSRLLRPELSALLKDSRP